MPRKKSARKTAENSNDAKLTENLRKIYENEDGSLPDMKIIDQEKTGRFWKVLGKLAAIIVLGVTGYFAWQLAVVPRLQFSDDVGVALTGAESVAPGEASNYVVRYRNPSATEVKNAELFFEYPRSFLLTSSTHQFDPESKRIKLGTLVAGASGEVLISGQWAQDFGTTSTITAVLSYTPHNFSSVFEKNSALLVGINKPGVEFVWTMAAAPTTGRSTTVQLVAKTLQPLSRPGTLKIFTPNSFALTDSTPTSSVKNSLVWEVATSTPELSVTLRGTFSTSSEAGFTAELKGFVSTTPVLLGRSTKLPEVGTIKKAGVVVTILDQSEKATAKPGTVLPITIVATNPGKETITNATVRLMLDTPSYQKKSWLNWSKITDQFDGTITGEQLSPEVRRGVITWTAKEIKELAELAPGAQVKITLSLPIKTTTEFDVSKISASTISATSELRSGDLLIAASEPVTVIVPVEVDVRISATKTSAGYDVLWTVAKSAHTLKKVRVEADLYGEFTWDPTTVKPEAGTIDYNAKTKHLVWSVDSISATAAETKLAFSLPMAKFNPTQIDLIGSIKMTAQDVEADQPLNLQVPSVKAQ